MKNPDQESNESSDQGFDKKSDRGANEKSDQSANGTSDQNAKGISDRGANKSFADGRSAHEQFRPRTLNSRRLQSKQRQCLCMQDEAIDVKADLRLLTLSRKTCSRPPRHGDG